MDPSRLEAYLSEADFEVRTAFLFELHLQSVQPDCWQIKQASKRGFWIIQEKTWNNFRHHYWFRLRVVPISPFAFRLSPVGWFSRALAFLRPTPIPEEKWGLLVVYCWFPRVESTKERAQKFHTDGDLASASDWLKQIALLLRPIRTEALPRSW